MSQDVGKLRCRIAQVPLYMQYFLCHCHLKSLWHTNFCVFNCWLIHWNFNTVMWHLALNEYQESKKGLWSHLFQNKRLKGAKKLYFCYFYIWGIFSDQFWKKILWLLCFILNFMDFLVLFISKIKWGQRGQEYKIFILFFVKFDVDFFSRYISNDISFLHSSNSNSFLDKRG